ncbi:hypothetical protein [Aromatoleum bremense]|uniref:Uncharacterized protein n=1 Tax=Aromatoleum bremense TaxID=76115 RepID=A0ABX1NXQ1_9RHOO|nr:hypothetical protein [Aromatoleum bremense]NMG16247.1 hypothetical protein [Aromatoleum bremense]QTQ30109.1 Uncharacterized protein pbN1_01160 [Aromatoleum bremense]
MRHEWPPGWGAESTALFNFFSVHAVGAGDTVEIYKGIAKIAVVPVDIDFTMLRKTLPLLIDSYERGAKDGRASLAADFRSLLDVTGRRD